MPSKDPQSPPRARRLNRKEFEDFMERMFREEIMPTRKAGQEEYAQDDARPFANFERIAEELELDRKKVLWVYAMKHKDGIASWLKGHQMQREGVEGRITDLIIYLFLLWGMVVEGEDA